LSRRSLRGLRQLFEGPWFAVFMLAVLLLWNTLLLIAMLAPDTQGAMGEFTADFKRRCLTLDADTGSVVWGNALPYIVAPLVLGVATWLVYRRSLSAAFRRPKALSICVSAALGVVIAGAVGLVAVSRASAVEAGDSPAFPAAKLRTEMSPPEFRLTNQDGQSVSPQDCRGQVVMLTAIYSTCTDMCPMVLAQGKNVMAALSEEERASVRVFAVTLDPERDDQRSLKLMAEGHRVEAPQWNLVTGTPREVNPVIESMGVWRQWNAEKGRLDHANVFLLIDRRGRLAYRFSLGDTQEKWLIEALKLLVAEPEPKP
jgi:protein SCO1/2